MSFSINSQVIEPEMIFIEGGSFLMGSTNGQDDEKPVHKVEIKDFYIGKYEITVEQYRKFCDATSKDYPKEDSWTKKNHPAVYISWFSAVEFCEWLSRETGKKYRLPTEAEWEYAARGGKKQENYKYCGSDSINLVAWYVESIPEDGTQRVGTRKPNSLGIYDMCGNAWEWCLDRYSDDYYKDKNNGNNPQGPDNGNWRVVRGGSWADSADHARVCFRQSNIPVNAGFNDGFRVVLEISK